MLFCLSLNGVVCAKYCFWLFAIILLCSVFVGHTIRCILQKVKSESAKLADEALAVLSHK